jgi:beta-galactosidase
MTTNCKSVDYWKWASEVDIVANDHYLKAERTDNHVDLAMAADLSRSLAGGAPWLVMEHSTSAVSWQNRNIAKRPGEMRRNSLTHVARGADGALFFQWRAAQFGAEKFHSTMLPHSGTAARGWRDVVDLGASLTALSEVAGARVIADAAVVWDWESWWALELEWRPSADLAFMERMNAFYGALWRVHRTVDFVHPEADISSYPLVVMPSSYVLSAASAANLRRYVEGGGTLVVSFFSGIVDGNDAIHLGGHPGALRGILGLTIEEFLPLRVGESVRLEGGLTADLWAEDVRLTGAEAVCSYLDGPAAGGPAVTRHRLGEGEAWYLSTRLSGQALDDLLGGFAAASKYPAEVELVRRQGADACYLFVVNHGSADVTVAATGVELLTGGSCAGGLIVPAGQVRVVREA